MMHYNRNNPFLYILEQSNDELINECQELVKGEITLHLLTLIWIIIAGVKCVIGIDFTLIEIVILAICILTNHFAISCVKNAIMYNKMSYINRKKYPEESITTYMNLNNEEMFRDALQIKTTIGKIKGFAKAINHMSFMILAGILIYAINIVIIIL